MNGYEMNGYDRFPEVLAAVCDTYVPSVPALDDEPSEFFARTASDLDIPRRVAVDGPTEQLLTELAGAGFLCASQDERRTMLRERAVAGPHREALRRLRGAVLGAFYSLPDAESRNPNWAAIGYPGPASVPPSASRAPKEIPTADLDGAHVHDGRIELDADVCVVGSGAGGSVVAAELARAGWSVLVVEAGEQYSESDFRQLEVDMSGSYLRGGAFFSEGGTIGLLAGSTLGGGTVINSMVCLDPPRRVRQSWASAGLHDIATPAFDEHLAAVRRRLNVNTEHTVLAPAAEPMVEGLEKLGHSWELVARNCSADDDARFCGYCNAGCQHGAKRSTLKTYLADAVMDGARVLVRTTVERILVEDGSARGVIARTTRQDGSSAEVVVNAKQVVAAAGGIETPALLLRSGIGGPAAGKYLRLHPAYFVNGVYDRQIHAWTGQIQSAVSFAFHSAVADYGFLVEHVTLSPMSWAAQLDWTGGAEHKREMRKLARVAPWHGVAHDHGSGEVVLVPDGQAVVRWRLADPVDRQVAARAHVDLARLHRAAGAKEIYTFHVPEFRWRQGDDFDAFCAELAAAEHEGVPGSAHQLGSARMGDDPATSVGDSRGELHDVRGVWIGDASAMPTSPAVNPMIATMALARRTAHEILARRTT